MSSTSTNPQAMKESGIEKPDLETELSPETGLEQKLLQVIPASWKA